jgi:hypothetical protein
MSNYTYHGTRDLIVMPGQSVQTFPSGLVRVERSFMCRKADVARHKNILRVNEPMPFVDFTPAIDGLFIFPEPQEQVRDDGFVEFRVTAYGRTTTNAQLAKGFISGIFTTTFPKATNEPPFRAPVLYATYTFSRVIDSAQSLEIFSDLPQIEAFALDQRGLIIKAGSRFDSTFRYDTFMGVSLSNFSSANFGVFSEYIYTYQSFGQRLISILMPSQS